MHPFSLNAHLSPMTPGIHGVLKKSGHVLYCHSCLNQMPELFLHVDFLQVNYALQVAPQVEVSRCGTGQLWVVRVKKLLYTMGEMSRISFMCISFSLVMFPLSTIPQ